MIHDFIEHRLTQKPDRQVPFVINLNLALLIHKQKNMTTISRKGTKLRNWRLKENTNDVLLYQSSCSMSSQNTLAEKLEKMPETPENNKK